jgi:transposase InsO family protein
MPAASTIGDILKRHGLIKQRRRRVHTPPYTKPFAQCSAPNSVWCVDFKGHFKTQDGVRCYPLTIMDAYSRFLIRCEGVLDPDTENVRPIFESAFREFGMPAAVRSDNGPPFASSGAGGLTALSVWWLKLGIAHERIAPGKPQQNGRHERMHRTLKQETATPPHANLRSQQRAFDRFVRLYNEERPHEALDQRAPATEYAPSTRHFVEPSRASFNTPETEQVLVDRDGFVRRGRAKIFIARALADELVDFHPAGDCQWEVRFGSVPLGIIDETRFAKGLIRPKQRKRPREVSIMSPV